MRNYYNSDAREDLFDTAATAALKNRPGSYGTTRKLSGAPRPRLGNCIIIVMLMSALNGCATGSAVNVGEQKNPKVDLFSLSVDAQLAYKESRWFDAVRLYQEIVHFVPGDATAWFRLANTYAQQGAYDRAIHAYNESLKYDGDQSKAWFNLSTTYVLQARSAMQNSSMSLAAGSPAGKIIEERLETLDSLILGNAGDIRAYQTHAKQDKTF